MVWIPRMALRRVMILCLGLPGLANTCGADVLINEVLYDPAGPDAGHEFIELHNTTGRLVVLDGYVLEAGNGSSPGDWRAQWRGSRQDLIAAGGYFVVAGEEAAAPADAHAGLILQNGPDAVRLCRAGAVVDCVGWGALTHGEFFEGEPTEDVPSGWVLARVPNAADSGSNYNDWLGRPWGTPGRTNTPAFGAQILGASWEPPILDVGRGGQLRVDLRNLGSGLLHLDAVDLSLNHERLGFRRCTSNGASIATGETTALIYDVSPDTGAWAGWIDLQLLLDGVAQSASSVAARVGVGPVVISELSYDPAAGEGEWIELRNHSPGGIDLSSWSMEDASGQRLVVEADIDLPPGAVCVVAQDEAAFLAQWPGLSAAVLIPWEGRWPSLNNQVNREWGFADQVLIRDAGGIPSDYVRYRSSEFDGDGVSLERWIEDGRLVSPEMLIPCSASEGATPGASSLESGAELGGRNWLKPFPNPFYPDRADAPDLCRLSIPPPAGSSSRVTADVFDLAGHRVCCLSAAAQQETPLILSWDGRSSARDELPTGIYIWRVTLQGGVRGDRQQVTCPVTLVRGE